MKWKQGVTWLEDETATEEGSGDMETGCGPGYEWFAHKNQVMLWTAVNGRERLEGTGVTEAVIAEYELYRCNED